MPNDQGGGEVLSWGGRGNSIKNRQKKKKPNCRVKEENGVVHMGKG